MPVLAVILMIVACILVVLATIVMRNRYPAGSTEMGLAMLACALWVVMAAADGFLPLGGAGRQVVLTLRYVGTSLAPTLFFLFVIRHALDVELDRKWVALLLVVPFLSAVVTATNPMHGWMLRVDTVPVAGVRPPWGPYFRWVHVPYLYGLTFASLGVLFVELVRGSVLERTQSAVLILGAMVPFFVNVIYITNPTLPDAQQTPLSFGFTALVFSWGFFRFRLFQLSPLAMRAAFDVVSDAVLLVDRDLRLTDLNPEGRRLLDPDDDDDPLGRPVQEVLAKAGMVDVPLEDGAHALIATPTGAHFETEARVVRRRQGRVRGHVLVLRDVTHRVRWEREMRVSQELVRGVVDRSPLGILRVRPIRDRAGYIRDFSCVLSNPVADRALLSDDGTLVGRSFTEVRPPHTPVVMDLLRRVARSGRLEETVVPVTLPDIGERWVRIQTTPVGEDLLVTFVDATREVEMEAAANHDELTGLLNRRGLERDLGVLIDSALARGGVAALFYMDLDRFKVVNDMHGHAVGDEVLVAFARRLEECLRVDDLVGRLGGDEFAAFVRGATRDEVEAVAERVRRCGERPYRIGDLELEVGTSVGEAYLPDDGTEFDDLLRAADAAMYREKA